jgi:hypothetical protein
MNSQQTDPAPEPHHDDEFIAPRFLGTLRYSETDRATIARRLAEAGGSEEEIAEAERSGTLGALALDLALRPPGEMASLADAAARAGLSLDEAITLWRALGFAVPSDGSLRLTSAEARMLQVLMELGREVVGEERILGFARVLGWPQQFSAKRSLTPFASKSRCRGSDPASRMRRSSSTTRNSPRHLSRSSSRGWVC